MFGIGFPELIIIGIIALLVFGPNKLPDLAKGLAKGLKEFKKATQEMKENLDIDENFKEDIKGIKENLDGSLREIKADITDSVTEFNKALSEETPPSPDTTPSNIEGTAPAAEGPQTTNASEDAVSTATQESPGSSQTTVIDSPIPAEPPESAGLTDAAGSPTTAESAAVAGSGDTEKKEKPADEGR